MASIINAATSGGLVTTADTSGILQLQTASTTAVTVTASQNVGIGTASPGARLGILVSGMTNQVSLGANASNSAYGSISFGASNLDTGRIGFTAGGNTDLNLYVDVPSGGTHQFRNATTTMVTVNSAGNLKTIGTISVGNATPSTSGAGITFPATQVASSDANTLDDYEEGNWTPTVAATTTNPTVSSYPTRIGRYVKIGKQVTIYCGIQNNSSGGSGNLKITGLPFQATSDDCTFSGVSALNGDFSWGTSKTGVLFAVGANQSHIDVYATQNGVAQAGIPIGNFNADSKYLNITLTYFV